MAAGQALVLGGGGVAAIAWITGLLAGLAESGADVSSADVVLGTSAGAAVAAQLGSLLPLEVLYERQADPALQSAEIPAVIDWESFGEALARQAAGAASPQEAMRKVGAFALAAQTVPEAGRRVVIASRLPSHHWPARDIRLVAVNCQTGAAEVFTSSSGISLVDAVAASCAVPGIWPPVTIGGYRYMDGGARSMDNADLAEGAERVVIVSPAGLSAQLPGLASLPEAVAKLRGGGAQVTIIEPDAASRTAMGANPLDPATRTPAAKAGREQGRRGLNGE